MSDAAAEVFFPLESKVVSDSTLVTVEDEEFWGIDESDDELELKELGEVLLTVEEF